MFALTVLTFKSNFSAIRPIKPILFDFHSFGPQILINLNYANHTKYQKTNKFFRNMINRQAKKIYKLVSIHGPHLCVNFQINPTIITNSISFSFFFFFFATGHCKILTIYQSPTIPNEKSIFFRKVLI